MQSKISKIKFPFICILFSGIYWMLLGLKLKSEGRLYSEVVLPVRGLLDSDPSVKIDLNQIEMLRHQIIEAVNISFALIVLLALFLLFSNDLTKTQRAVGSIGVIILAGLFFVIPRIS